MSDMSAGQIIGGIIGAVIGAYAGGPAGAAQGFALGAGIGGYIDPPPGPNLRGPTLDDKSFQSTAYGVSIATLHGSIATMGSIVYLENNEYKSAARKKSTGGKGGGGGGSVTTTTYYATFSIALANAMPGSLVRRIWLGGVLWYSANSDDPDTILQSNANAGFFRYADGTQTDPDSRMEGVMGIGNTPSYEGTAMLHVYDLDLTDYGNGLAGCPVKVEIVQDPNYIDDISVFETLTMTGSSDYTRAALCLRPLMGSSDRYTSTIYSLVLSGDEYAWSISQKTPDDYVSYLSSSGEYTASYGVIGYSDRSVYCYGEERIGGLETYIKLITNVGEYELPPIYFSDTRFPFASFYRFYDTDFGVFFIIKTNSYSSVLLPDRYYFWKYGDSDSNVLLLPYYFIMESCVIDGIYVSFYSQITNQLIRHNLSDYSWADEYYLTSTASIVSSALINNGFIYYLNAVESSFLSGEILITIIDTSNFVSRQVEIFIDPTETSSFFGGFRPTMSLADNILAISCISGDYDIKIYLINLMSVERGSASLADIVESKLIESGLLPSEYDLSELEDDYVDGYRISEASSARGAIGQLQVAYLFDFIEAGYTIKAVKRGADPVITIPYEHLGANTGGAPGTVVSSDYETSTQLPSRYTISYLDFNREYDSNTQYADYPAHSVNERNTQLAIVMTADKAAQLADTLINLAWVEKKPFNFNLPQIYLGLKPSDVYEIEISPGIFVAMRMESVSIRADQVLEVSARPTRPSVYQSSAAGVDAIPPPETIPRIGVSTAIMMDIPLVLDSMDFPGLVVGMYGSNNWPGGVLMSSADNGQVYVPLQAFTEKTTAGTAIDVLPADEGVFIDRTSELTISVLTGEFYSVTEDQMMTGTQYLAYGVDGRWEIVQYTNADLQIDTTVKLSGLLRGLRGTEWATGLHQAGDFVVLLDDPDNAFVGTQSSAIGVDRLYKAVTVKSNAADTVGFNFTYRANNLKPLSVVSVTGINSSGDWIVSFMPRSRLSSSEWTTGQPAPIGESTEAYEIDVIGLGDIVVKTYRVLTPEWEYTTAEQVVDFGDEILDLSIKIYQISSAVGRGLPASAEFSVAATAPDPHWALVTMLLHFNGSNGSTTFTDEVGHTMAVASPAQISTAAFKFGGASGLFDGVAGFINATTGADFEFAADLTIECWIKPVNTSDVGVIFDSRVSGPTSTGLVVYKSGSTINLFTSNGARLVSPPITAGVWVHIALVRASGVFRMYINGVGGSTYSNAINMTDGRCYIGRDSTAAALYWNGNIDEFRITKYARYTADFAPQTAQFPNH